MQKLSQKLLKGEFPFPEDVAVGKTAEMPERIIQFGEGNFLRAFVDWMVDEMNKQDLFNGKVVIVQPIEQGMIPVLNEQDGLYTLLLRGVQDGQVVEKKQIVTSVSRGINPYTHWKDFLNCASNPDLRFMVSNTTEAGIAYVKEPQPVDRCPVSFPSKVTAFLYERYKKFQGASDKGMIVIPCELIDRNGDQLKAIVLRYAEEWGLEENFKNWLESSCHFLNTLVDRIVTGYPKDEIQSITEKLGYEDKLMDTGEIFHLWVIEGDRKISEELPFTKAGLNVLWTDDMEPYRTRKVRILNGAHTMTVLAAYLYGKDTVKECVDDPIIGDYMNKGLFEEIIPTLDLPQEEKTQFAAAVHERFSNPFIRHMLLSISLNSVSKFKVRVLPSLLEYINRKNCLPRILTFSLAALIAFYRGTEIKGDALLGSRNKETYEIKDDKDVLEFFKNVWDAYERKADSAALVDEILSREDFWGQDLSKVPGLAGAVAGYLDSIVKDGMQKSIRSLMTAES